MKTFWERFYFNQRLSSGNLVSRKPYLSPSKQICYYLLFLCQCIYLINCTTIQPVKHVQSLGNRLTSSPFAIILQILLVYFLNTKDSESL